MDYLLNKDEDYRDFTNRALKGQIDDKKLQLFIILLEIIVTEIGTAAYSIVITVKPKEITIHIIHQGNAIKNNILAIIDDQVDYLHYYHQAHDTNKRGENRIYSSLIEQKNHSPKGKDNHILTIRVKRNENEPR